MKPLPLALTLLATLLVACAGSPADPSPDPSGLPGGAPTEGAPDDTDPNIEPPGDEGEFVVPVPRRFDPRAVPVDSLRADLQPDGRLLVTVGWMSGVEPCAVLDQVGVIWNGSTATLTIIEGTSDLNAACVMIAVPKRTRVDMGVLEPGTYTIVADPANGAEPLTVTVP